MIKLDHIFRTFKVGDELVHGLDDVCLDIKNGEYISIMGPSGSGKSTLLNAIGLLDQLDDGRYFLDGTDVTELTELEQATVRREKIGFVFQTFHLVPRLTAAENIALPLTLAGVDHAEREHRVSEALESLSLSDRSHHRPDQLSGGQRQRVAIARAVVTKPLVILADEPTGNLDHASGIEVINILEELNQQGLTLLLVTHDIELGERAHRIIHMMDGKVLQ
ncbi:MAG: ABC transporter ATP-binding protein [Gammaproteobacteria bacterium]|nr:ABC transporter ATP-binding protein [Gammaproteobacteria bacterium]MCK5262760.1 ABC transporter ATP-binding protein [Gammaproteobacteria bacterium]